MPRRLCRSHFQNRVSKTPYSHTKAAFLGVLYNLNQQKAKILSDKTKMQSKSKELIPRKKKLNLRSHKIRTSFE